MFASLTVVDGPGRGRTVLVSDGGLVMGRTREADIMLPDPDVSRRHALVRSGGGRTVITDLGSTNGTRVNGRWLDGPRELHPGDEVAVGSCLLRFDAAASRAAVDDGRGRSAGPALDDGRGWPGGPALDDGRARPGGPAFDDGRGWPAPGDGWERPAVAPAAAQSGHAQGGGTVVQGMRDAIHARWHIGTFGTGGLVAGVALALVVAAGIVVVAVNRVDLGDLTGSYRNEGGVSGAMTTDPSTMTVAGDGTFRFRGGIRMGIGQLGTAMTYDCRGEAETGFGHFSFHSTSGVCGDFSGELVSDGRALELSGDDDRAPMTLTRTA